MISAIAYGLIIVVFAGYAAAMRNVQLSSTTLQGGHALGSYVHPPAYGFLTLKLLFLSVISLGLLVPYATITRQRVLLSQTFAWIEGPLDDVVQKSVVPGGAAGAELGVLEGVADGVTGGLV